MGYAIMAKRSLMNSAACTSAHNVQVAGHSPGGVESSASASRNIVSQQEDPSQGPNIFGPGDRQLASHVVVGKGSKPLKLKGNPSDSLSLTIHNRPAKAFISLQQAEFLRDSLHGYYRMRDVAIELRQEETAAGADLRTRLAWANVIATIDGWIAERQRELSVIARRGGRGVPAVTP